jgi:hypothetical protein
VLHCADRATTWVSDESRQKGELVVISQGLIEAGVDLVIKRGFRSVS